MEQIQFDFVVPVRPAHGCGLPEFPSEPIGCEIGSRDLSEFLGHASRLELKHAGVAAKLESIRVYAPAPGVPQEKLVQMATLGVVLDDWMEENAIAATAIRCWTSVQHNDGCNMCTLMNRNP